MSQFIINTKKIAHNISVIRKSLKQNSRFMYVIKANAYGFGATKLIKFLPLELIDYFGVSRISEACELAPHIDKPIVLLKNTFISELEEGIAYSTIEYTFSDLNSLKNAIAWCNGNSKKISIHLKVNTGMNRLGLTEADLEKAVALAKAESCISLAGIYTHFANADDEKSEFTAVQNARFSTIVDAYKPQLPRVIFHAANSAATIASKETHHDMVRCGLICYGIFPPLLAHLDMDLQEAIEIKTQVIQVLDIKSGDGVGYGQTYTAKSDTRIASLAIGYADGINRSLSNKGMVYINGQLCPIIGNISMDQISILIGDLPVSVEDDAYLVAPEKSDDLTTNQLAKLCETLPYELLISIGGRVDRVYLS